jgi:hypothetical protein
MVNTIVQETIARKDIRVRVPAAEFSAKVKKTFLANLSPAFKRQLKI